MLIYQSSLFIRVNNVWNIINRSTQTKFGEKKTKRIVAEAAIAMKSNANAPFFAVFQTLFKFIRIITSISSEKCFIKHSINLSNADRFIERAHGR